MNKILKNTVILTIITLVSGVALGGVYQITKEPIAKAQEEAKQEAYQQVFEDADAFEVLKVDAQEAADAVASAGVDDGAVIDEAVEAIQGGEERRERPRQHDVDAHRQRVIPAVHFPREPHRLTHDAPSIRRRTA